MDPREDVAVLDGAGCRESVMVGLGRVGVWSGPMRWSGPYTSHLSESLKLTKLSVSAQQSHSMASSSRAMVVSSSSTLAQST
jgi:hypothetical protein